MSFVDGVVLDTAERARARSRRTPARRACEQLVDTLVELHAVDPASVGLADFGRPDGFLARQVKRWHAAVAGVRDAGRGPSSTRWSSASPRPCPRSRRAGDRARRLPADQRHVTDRTSTGIAAVVDWEMATLGDPLTDVGLLAVYHDLAADSDGVMPAMSPADGFLTAEQMVARYAAGSGRDLSELDWYIALRLLQARRHLRGHPPPLPAGQDRRRGVRADSAPRAATARRGPAPVGRPLTRPSDQPGARHGLQPQRALAWPLQDRGASVPRRARLPGRARVRASRRPPIAPPGTPFRTPEVLAGLKRGRPQAGPVEPVPARRAVRRRAVACSTTRRSPSCPGGRWRIAPEAMNCAAPDTGNMELLAMFAHRRPARALARAAARGRDPVLLLDDRARRRLVGRHQHRHHDHRGRRRVRGRTGASGGRRGAMRPECKFAIVMGVSDPDAERHARHSMILVPLDAPGVTDRALDHRLRLRRRPARRPRR